LSASLGIEGVVTRSPVELFGRWDNPFTRTVSGLIRSRATVSSQRRVRQAESRVRKRGVDETIILEFDGGSRGNPGPAGVGVVLRARDGTTLLTLGRSIGRATNNVAEYKALITGLQEAKKLGVKKLLIKGDSELIVKQMTGEYRVKNADLRDLYDDAQFLLHQFDEARFQHNVREKNALADRLANLAMDRRADVTEVNEPGSIDEPAPAPTRVGDQITCPRCGCVIEVRKPSPIRPHQLRPFGCQCGMKMRS
jgi:ribonuclease HI